VNKVPALQPTMKTTCQQCDALLSAEQIRRRAKLCGHRDCRRKQDADRKIEIHGPPKERKSASCSACGAEISEERNRCGSAKWCSQECRSKARARRTSASYLAETYLSTGAVGAIGELIVSADLLRYGYEVFRAVSQSCSTDLVALRNGRTMRVEVRTGRRTSTGISCGMKAFRSDVLAVVIHGPMPAIVYDPPLPDSPNSSTDPPVKRLATKTGLP
jgi:hypothetical protein